MIGQTISHYKITGKLGEGGMGVVYKAEDLRLQRPVALKFLPSNSWGNQEAKARFFREARAAAALQHPNICTVYEIDEVDGQLFIAMAYLEGRELVKEIEDGPLGVDRLLDLAIQTARGLEEAHRSGVVHRDIKPANIMVSSGGRAVLMDFGLAQLNSATSKLTREGTTVGTSAYMSPEQTTGEPLDHRTDIWAFGVVLYEMATGELPFKGYYEQAVLYSILNDPPEPVTALRPNAPGELERILNKCLAKRADERYQTTGDLLADLSELKRRVESGEGPPPEPLETQPPKPRLAFVGREEETTELGQLLESARQGNGSLVLIGGEPGVGKTRLCEEMLADAGEQQMLVLVGHCYEGEGAQPFIPFVESLELASRIVPRAEFRAALGEAAPEVVKLMPELRRTFPDIPEAIQLPAEQQRRYLFNSFRDFVSRLSKQRPIVWLLDDLHWADESSLLLLQHFAPGLENLPVLVLGTYRDVELEVGKPFEKALTQLVRQRLARRMALKRLPQVSVADLLAIFAGEPPPESLVKVIYQETEGNPFFVEEVFTHLSEEGKLFDQDGHWKPDLKADELEVPEGVRLVIGRRLERLSSQTPKILSAAAVIGRAFDLGTLESLEGFDPDDVLDAIDEAERVKLVASSSTGRELKYRFTHELIRQTLLIGLSLPRRQRMHLRVANAIEKKRQENVGSIAHHLFQAGMAADPEKTVRYLSLAGEGALGAAAADEARRYFDDALSLDIDDEETQAKLLLGRGHSYAALGRAEEALRDLEAALSVFEQLKASETVAAICCELTPLLWWSLGRIDDALTAARRGLDAVGEAPSADRCRLLAAEGSALSVSRRYSDAESKLEQAATMAATLADRNLEGEVYRYKAQHYWIYLRMQKGIDAGTRAINLLRSSGDLWGLADALAWTHPPLRCMGRVEESLSLLEESETLANRVGHFNAIWNARAMRMYQMLFRGDLGGLETTGRDTLEWCLKIGIYWGICQTYALLALLELWRWRYDNALDYARQSLAAEGDQAIPISSRPTLMLVQAYAGEKEALRQIDEIDLPTPGKVSHLGKITELLFVIEALAVLGEDDAAAKLYPLMSEPLGCMKIACFGALMPETAAGISAAAGRDWDTAEAHFQTALRYAEEFPHKLEQPQVRYWYAKMLIDRGAAGDRDKARELLEGAIREYQTIGMPRHLEMARELLAGI